MLIQSVASIGEIESVVREAVRNKGGVLWAELQKCLFTINLRLMRDGFALGSRRAEFEWKLRNLVETVEAESQPELDIPDHLSEPEQMISWLKERIAEHRVNHHRLFDYFDNDDLSDEEIRYFLSNYRVNMQRFHLHVAAYSLFVPFEMREELYENLHDEFGEGNFDAAHPNLFEPLMEYFGGAREEDWNPETFHLLNTKMALCWFADGLHYGMGGMGALELSIPAQQKRVLASLRRKGLSEELVKFFVVHCELDESHGDGWFAAGLPYMNSRAEFAKVYQAAMRMLEARAGVYDGILAGIRDRRMKASVGIRGGMTNAMELEASA
ncbi:MAG: iron-containing redox enzyme family protein [Pseudomonadota bacterium]|nr:iron-containing redox enzyme family protein [Pseudomonadota bacterium]